MKKGMDAEKQAAFWKSVAIGLILGILIGIALNSFSGSVTGNVVSGYTINIPFEGERIEVSLGDGTILSVPKGAYDPEVFNHRVACMLELPTDVVQAQANAPGAGSNDPLSYEEGSDFA